ncbi:MAG: CbiX/SirB N-terminal domain-containing protein [Kineosporiaceae bacterium]
MTRFPEAAPPWDAAAPVLVAAAHGTRLASGRRRMAELRLAVAAARPDVRVLAANVDEQVQRPGLERVLAAEAAQGRPSVIVPLLLSAGYHMAHDVAGAVVAAQGWAAGAASLGPHPDLVTVLSDHLAGACTARGGTPSGLDAVVLAAAGSSDPRAVADVEETARMLADAVGVSVTAAYLSAAAPKVEDAVASLRGRGAARIGLATYLIAPGVFADRLERCGADVVSATLAPHPLLTRLILRRYDEAAADARQVAALA